MRCKRDDTTGLRDCFVTFSMGNWTVNVLPNPSPAEYTESTPSCKSTIPLQMYKPKPDPPPDCSFSGLNCITSLNNFFWFSAEIPAPESITLMYSMPADNERKEKKRKEKKRKEKGWQEMKYGGKK